MIRNCSPVVSVAIAGLALSLGLVGCDKSITDRDIVDIPVSEVVRLSNEAKTKPEAVLLMDPRRAQEFQAGHLPGAKNVQIDEFSTQLSRQGRIPAYEKYDVLVVYGNDPASAVGRAMTKRLLANEYKDVYWFKGGIEEWVANGGLLEKSQ